MVAQLAPALPDNQVIGMPSRAVDEAWHGLILCTARYAAYAVSHHHPEGGAPAAARAASDPSHEQLRRTVIAWQLVAQPDEQSVLWDLDERVGVERPWGISPTRVAEIRSAVARFA
ncbi:MAG: hypothetical protein QOD58_1068 [Mycobacterium sp.]|nr:hypothetical protein [Mycobacterium sp.]